MNETETNQPRLNPYLFLLPVVFAIGVLAGYLIWGRGGGSASQAVPVAAATQPVINEAAVEQIKRYPVPVDDDPGKGPQDAEIVIIEFSDYECPFCRKWYNEVYAKLFENYAGKLRLVFRDFPLTNIHPQAQPAAEAANCANDQGKYFEFHDKLFGMQYELGEQAYLAYAKDLNLDMSKFEQCLADRRYQQEVEADLSYAANIGVNSTPTFFVNGIPVVGAQPYEVFEYLIEKELAGELPK